ncbi:MAG: TetR/AcrR family transcriptional regulator [Hyphomonadaceae bacterium]
MRKSAAESLEPVSFRDWVARKQKSGGIRRKGERTRDRIRLCTVELLNEVGYRDLKLTDICKRAKISPPVLYLYFESKEALVHEILVEFLQEFMNRATSASGRSPFQAMFDANLQWIRSARANAGLMRCLLQFSEAQGDFAALFAQESHEWNLRITAAIIRRFPAAERAQAQVHFVVEALGGMMDDITRRLFADNDEHLTAVVSSFASTDEDLARALTTLWHRALYCMDPPKSEATPLAPRLLAAAQSAPAPRAGARKRASD